MNNLGYYAYFRGDWSEALSCYERARDLFMRTGNVVDAAIDKGNIGDVLLFQGRLDEAAQQFSDALRIFRASGVRPKEVFALAELAGTASRAGRFDEASAMFDQAEALVREVGDEHAADVAGLRAESLVLEGRAGEAIAVIDALMTSLPSEHPFVPWLLRNRGYALAQAGDRAGAQRTLRNSLRSARSIGADHDVAFVLEAFIRCGLSDGRSAEEMQRERDLLNDRLGIVAVPTVPLPDTC
jgi:tetratricopeptide (TPR) repeat protein